MTEKELIKKIANVCWDSVASVREEKAIEIISNVKSSIGSVAEVCPRCKGTKETWDGVDYSVCEECKGFGVIARGDK
jgi:DnaJ-class molecular chaperone